MKKGKSSLDSVYILKLELIGFSYRLEERCERESNMVPNLMICLNFMSYFHCCFLIWAGVQQEQILGIGKIRNLDLAYRHSGQHVE